MPDDGPPWKAVQIGVLVGDTGEKPRTIQHWSDLGILRPQPVSDKRGRGNYRTYRAEPYYGERTYALLASAYAERRLPLGDIRHLIYAERLMLDPVELLDKNDPNLEIALRHREERDRDKEEIGFVDSIEAALAGEPDVYAIFAEQPREITPFHFTYLRHQKGLAPYFSAAEAKRNSDLLLKSMTNRKTALI